MDESKRYRDRVVSVLQDTIVPVIVRNYDTIDCVVIGSRHRLLLYTRSIRNFFRETVEDGSIYAVINLGSEEETVDLSAFDNVSSRLKLYYATPSTDFVQG